jgi:hypothetical protein
MESGEARDAEELLLLVCDELRCLAFSQMTDPDRALHNRNEEAPFRQPGRS